eukprot:Skav207821  [mRNA]  locus=scaffold2902:31383:38674:- [translate_table: standard]
MSRNGAPQMIGYREGDPPAVAADESWKGPGHARLKAKSEGLLPKRQSSGKLGGGLCGLSGMSGDLRGSLGGGLSSWGSQVSELLASLKQVQEKQNKARRSATLRRAVSITSVSVPRYWPK